MYNDHYGLSGRPFQLTPDPKFWFESATHRKAMAYLGYGLAQGEGFIVVTGEIGAGKTTLTGHLMETVDPARVNAVRIVSTQVDHEDMLRMVAQALTLPADGDKAQLLGRIESFVTGRARAGQKTLLIIDEAQNLPNASLEELRMLSNFTTGGQAMLQIFLLGQPEFRERLNQAEDLEQLRQRVIATHHLTAMLPEEIGPYVEHRLKLVGWDGTPAIGADAYAALHRYSGGLPRKINTLMTRVLLAASLEKNGQIGASTVDAVLADMDQDRPATEAVEQPMLTLVPPAASHSSAHDPATLDLAARVAMLEAQAEEQGAALRRVLGLLVDWVEADEAKHSDIRRAPAA